MYMLYSGKALKATYDKYNPPTKDGRLRERENSKKSRNMFVN